MKEADYITGTNIARVRLICTLLREICPDGKNITEGEIFEVSPRVKCWEARLEAACSKEARAEIMAKEPWRLDWPRPKFKTAQDQIRAIIQIAEVPPIDQKDLPSAYAPMIARLISELQVVAYNV